MGDLEDSGRPAESANEDATPVNDDKPTGEPAVKSEDGKSVQPAATPEDKKPEEPAKPQEPTIEELLERDDVKRTVQGAADRAYEKARKRFEDDVRQRAREAQSKTDEAERRKLIEEGDFDTLGRQEAAKQEAETRLMDALQRAGQVISGVTTERYAQVLGEETVDEIVAEVERKGGTIVDLNLALAEAEQERAVKKVSVDISKSFEQKLSEELEAMRAELGVQKRSDKVDEKGAEKVSGTPPASPPSGEEMTYPKASRLYGEGEMSWEEFAPFKAQHDKERNK